MQHRATAAPAVARFLAAQEELARVGDRLHGRLLQELSAMAMTVDLVRDALERGAPVEPVVAQLDDVLALVVGTARGMVRDLCPSLSTPEDFVFAMRDLVERRAPHHTVLTITGRISGEEPEVVRLLALRVLELVVDLAGRAGCDLTGLEFDGPDLRFEARIPGAGDPSAEPAWALLTAATRATGGQLSVRLLPDRTAVAAAGDPADAVVVRWQGPRAGRHGSG